MNWASTGLATRPLPQAQPHLTAFEELVREVGLPNRPDLWPYNDKLRNFAKRQRKHRYIPEEYLAALGLDSEVDL